MYLPVQFAERRIAVLHRLMRRHPFATLIVGSGDHLGADHLPVETLDAPAPLGMLRGHIARANPLWRRYVEDSEALVLFHGPQAYISPSWYASKEQGGEVVPTWNYAVVQARGKLRFTHDADWLRGVVRGLTDRHEAPRPSPWSIDDAPKEYIERMLGAIVGFELVISDLVGKIKWSQNKSVADRDGVRRGMQELGGAEWAEVADLLAP